MERFKEGTDEVCSIGKENDLSSYVLYGLEGRNVGIRKARDQ